MINISETVLNSRLFSGISHDDLEKMLYCLSARAVKYKKDDFVLLAGDTTDFVGLIIDGGIRIIRDDQEGNSTILTELIKSEIFAEVFACAGISDSPVTIQATEATEVLWLNYRKIITVCGTNCLYHTKLVENMIQLLAEKNLLLNDKIEILSKRSTKDKLLCFFDKQRGTAKKFSVPYNREEMACYLCVDRSAMSNELSKMRKAGLIKFKGNTFEILV